jgi:hypothetical protein
MEVETMRRRAALFLTLAAMLAMPAAMSGCLIHRSRQISYSGTRVENADLSRVRLNESTEADVERLLGTPTEKSESGEGSEVWTWRWRTTTSGQGQVFLLFNGSKTRVVEDAVHVFFRDGVAVDKWRG